LRTDLPLLVLATSLFGSVLFGSVLCSPVLLAQEGGESVADELSAGHGQTAPPPLLEIIGDELRLREKRLQSLINCACLRENWSRTLRNCPDACANPQKSEVLAQLKSGKTDQQIVDGMVAKYGFKVRSDPGLAGAGIWTRILPLAALLGGAWFAGRVMFRWQKAGEVARAGRARARNPRGVGTPA
jgi:cytochrome c-type biogenesis protein CcmH/NrfF